MNTILRKIVDFGYGESIRNEYEIYVPKGTILKNFSVDT